MAKKVKNNQVNFEKIAGTIRVSSVKDFIKANYKPYIDYAILDRALVREDGLKPVQRRGLWTLWVMGLKSNGGTKKANTVYGKTIGDYHPHGPASVSAAMAKLAQWYTSRVQLLEVQGSVGTETGDKPTADRYYEIKLSRAAELLIEDVKYKGVKMIPNYSNEKGKEIPEQFPTKWPYAIINGGSGIAVGYSTTMIPHNPTEVMDAVIERIKGNLKTTKKLLSIMKGPDMPTGGELLGLDGVQDYYETGKGTFIIRGTYEIESLPRGRHAIVFNSLPYQEATSNIISQIKKAQKKDKLKDITETKNLTDMDTGVRLVMYVKAGANPHLVVEELFKETRLQTKFSVNNTVIRDGRPVLAPMLDLIDIFINHRKECFVAKTEKRIQAIEIDLIKNKGLIKVLIDIDKVIEIIRKSDNAEVAKTKLMKHFKIDEVAADFILDMRLQKLTKQDKLSLENKVKDLEKELETLQSYIESEDNLNKAIIAELKETKKIIGDDRLTKITGISNEDLENEEKEMKKTQRLLNKDIDCRVVTLANNKVVKYIDDSSENTIPIKSEIKSTSQGKVLSIQRDGSLVEVDVESILLNNETDVTSLGLNPDKSLELLPTELSDDERVLVVTTLGNVALFKSIGKSPLVKLMSGEHLRYVKIVTKDEVENDDLIILSKDGTVARFNLNKIREVNSGAGTVAGMKADNIVVGATTVKLLDQIVSVSNKTVKVVEDNEVLSKNRGIKGSLLHKIESKGEQMVSIHAGKNIKAYTDDTYTKEYKLPAPTNKATKGTAYKNIRLV